MNLKKYKFREVTAIDMAFPTFGTDDQLLAEAHERGFYNGETKYNELFTSIFFRGGELKFKKGLDEDFKSKAIPYLYALMGSFAPKHEEKEAICAMLLSELTA